MIDICEDCLCRCDELQCSTCELNQDIGLSLEELREYDEPLDNYDGDDYSESLYVPDEDN